MNDAFYDADGIHRGQGELAITALLAPKITRQKIQGVVFDVVDVDFSENGGLAHVIWIEEQQGSTGGDGGGSDGGSGDTDLPYNVNIKLGDTFQLSDAFLMKGPAPAAVLSLTMPSPPDWRLQERQNNTPFVVTQTDCDHSGNHGTDRDRFEITWENQNSSIDSDHFTIRYCN